MRVSKPIGAAIITACLLAGCKGEPPPQEIVRPVVAMRVSDAEAFTERWFPGRAKATREADVAFEVPGRMVERPVLVGDLLSPLGEIGSVVDGFVAGGAHGHLLQVLDPAEEMLPFAGRVRFEGTEDDGEVIIGRVETVRDDYRNLLDGHRRGLAALAQSGAAKYPSLR